MSVIMRRTPVPLQSGSWDDDSGVAIKGPLPDVFELVLRELSGGVEVLSVLRDGWDMGWDFHLSELFTPLGMVGQADLLGYFIVEGYSASPKVIYAGDLRVALTALGLLGEGE